MNGEFDQCTGVPRQIRVSARDDPQAIIRIRSEVQPTADAGVFDMPGLGFLTCQLELLDDAGPGPNPILVSRVLPGGR